MAKERKSLYKRVIDLYETPDKDKDRMRHFLRKKLDNYSPHKTWDELPPYKKDDFVYNKIRETMLENYIDPTRKDEIREKIEKEASERLKKAQHNVDVRDNILREYDDYDEFCDAMITYNNKIPIPTKDEWIAGPKRVYDYAMNYYYDYDKLTGKESAPLDLINYYTLKAIVKVMEDKFKIEINTEEITACLNHLQNYPLNEEGTDLDLFADRVAHSTGSKLEEMRLISIDCWSRLSDIDCFITELQ